MFDYNKIDAIDPSFLDQYLNPAKTGAAAFGYAGDKQVSIVDGGRTFDFTISMREGLNTLWEDYAYDLVGSWGKVKSNSRSYHFSEKLSARKALMELERNTHCYDLEEVRTKGLWDKEKREMILPNSVQILSHEQVRQRVLCFVAIAMRAMDEDVLRTMLSNAARNKDGSLTRSRVIRVAHLNLYDFGAGEYSLRLGGNVTGPSSIELTISFREITGTELVSTTDLFNFPIGNKKREATVATEKKAAKAFSYDKMDEMFTLEYLSQIIQTDKNGKRSLRREKNRKLSCTVDGIEFTIKCNLATTLRRDMEYYEEYIEPMEPNATDNSYRDPAEVMRHVNVPEGHIDEGGGSFVHAFPEHFPYEVPPLSTQQVKLRYLWYMRACALATTDAVLEKIVQMAPKKKNGTLHCGRVMRVAAFYATGSGGISELVAKNESDTEITLTERGVDLWHDELQEIHFDFATKTGMFN